MNNGHLAKTSQVPNELDWWEWLTADDKGNTEKSSAHFIYRNNLLGAAYRSLQLTYPAVEKAIGLRNFQPLATQYVHHQLPLQRDLNEYGEGFLTWLMRHPQWQTIEDDLPFLASLCAFEWAWHKAYYADASAAFDIAKFEQQAAAAPEQILFSLDPALSLVSSDFNLPELRQQLISEGECEITSLTGTTCYWVIWPGPWEVCSSIPTEAQLQLVQTLGNHKPWGEWLEQIPYEALQQAIAQKWVVGS